MAHLLGRLRLDAQHPEPPYILRAGSDLHAGQVVVMDARGMAQPYTPHTRTERAVRWIGRVVRLRQLARWRERHVIGVALAAAGAAQEVPVVSSGVFMAQTVQTAVDDHNRDLQRLLLSFDPCRDEEAAE